MGQIDCGSASVLWACLCGCTSPMLKVIFTPLGGPTGGTSPRLFKTGECECVFHIRGADSASLAMPTGGLEVLWCCWCNWPWVYCLVRVGKGDTVGRLLMYQTQNPDTTGPHQAATVFPLLGFVCVFVVFYFLFWSPSCTFSSSPHLLQVTTGDSAVNQGLEQD